MEEEEMDNLLRFKFPKGYEIRDVFIWGNPKTIRSIYGEDMIYEYRDKQMINMQIASDVKDTMKDTMTEYKIRQLIYVIKQNQNISHVIYLRILR